MRRRLRDIGVSLAVLTLLFGMLMLINPRARESAAQMAGDAQSQQWDATSGPISGAAMGAISITSGYAADNPVMFSFAVVAALLFMLMVKSA